MPTWLEVLVILCAAAVVVCVATVLAYAFLGPTERDIEL